MDIETWIVNAVAALRADPSVAADAQERASDNIWTVEETRPNDSAASLGLPGSPVVQFRPELQRAANLDHVHLIQV